MDYVNGIPALAMDDAVSDVPLYSNELRAALVDDGGLIYDSGWVDLVTRTGFTPHSSFPPQVRRVGTRVFVRGGWTAAGLSAGTTTLVADVPVGFRPSVATGSSASAFGLYWAPSTNQIGRVRVYGDGGVELGTASGGVPSSLLAVDGMSWFVD